MSLDLKGSILYAIREYSSRHNGERPAKILMSPEAYQLTPSPYIVGHVYPETCAGIPIGRIDEDGIHIYLCEPEIHIFAEPDTNTIYIDRRNITKDET